MGPTLPFSPPAAAVGAYLLIAAATGVAVRLRAHVYHKDLAGDDETAFHLRRLRGRGVLVGAALTVAVTAGFRVGTAAGDAFAEAVDAETGVAGLDDGTAVDTVAGVVGASAAYLVPIALVVLVVRLATVPYQRAARDLRLRYRDAAAWELKRSGVGVVGLLAAVGVIAAVPSGWPRALVAVGLGFLVTVLAPVALVVALRTRWPTDAEHALVADLLPHGVALRVVDDRTRVGSAFTAGVIPGLKRVFVTESLFDVLDDEQLRAVVAHEVGHHEHNHVLLRFSLVAAAASVALTVASYAPVATVYGLVAGGVPLAVGLAWAVRHTERAADAYAAAVVGGPALAGALEVLADRRYITAASGPFGLLEYHPPLAERIERLRASSKRAVARTESLRP